MKIFHKLYSAWYFRRSPDVIMKKRQRVKRYIIAAKIAARKYSQRTI